MATMPITLGDNSLNNAGKPVIGNTGTANPNKLAPVPTPVSGVRPVIGANNGGILSTNPITAPNTTGTLLPSNSVPVTSVGPPSTATPSSSLVTPEEQKQLTDIYGKGTGNLLSSEISNLGSEDSSYMQAYKKAIAPINAENLATLNTTLGNEGISSDSSTAAIENADFMSNVTAQEGLQEKQLQMNDLAQLLGLTESTMPSSEKEVSSSVLGDIGDVLTAIGNVAMGHGIPAMGGRNSPVPIADSSQSGLLGLSNASTSGLSTDSPSLSAGIDSESLTPFIPV